jgi:hypothetical protein
MGTTWCPFRRCRGRHVVQSSRWSWLDISQVVSFSARNERLCNTNPHHYGSPLRRLRGAPSSSKRDNRASPEHACSPLFGGMRPLSWCCTRRMPRSPTTLPQLPPPTNSNLPKAAQGGTETPDTRERAETGADRERTIGLTFKTETSNGCKQRRRAGIEHEHLLFRQRAVYPGDAISQKLFFTTSTGSIPRMTAEPRRSPMPPRRPYTAASKVREEQHTRQFYPTMVLVPSIRKSDAKSDWL